jgi:hypothetical protein
LSHGASEARGQVRSGSWQDEEALWGLTEVRVARLRAPVGALDRTLVVVESKELLEGQKRGIAAALGKAIGELTKLQRLVAAGRIHRKRLEHRVKKSLRREHLSSFVVVEVGGS